MPFIHENKTKKSFSLPQKGMKASFSRIIIPPFYILSLSEVKT